jgi:predicted transcriptional regulator
MHQNKSKKNPGPPKSFSNRLTISLGKKERGCLTRIAKRDERSLAFVARKAIEKFISQESELGGSAR